MPIDYDDYYTTKKGVDIVKLSLLNAEYITIPCDAPPLIKHGFETLIADILSSGSSLQELCSNIRGLVELNKHQKPFLSEISQKIADFEKKYGE